MFRVPKYVSLPNVGLDVRLGHELKDLNSLYILSQSMHTTYTGMIHMRCPCVFDSSTFNPLKMNINT